MSYLAAAEGVKKVSDADRKNQSSGGGGKVDAGLFGNLLGIGAGLTARDRKREARLRREEAAQRRNEAMYNFGQAQAATERYQDLLPQMQGALQSEYLTPDMLIAGDRNQLGGGALETILNLSGGYNPAIANNPALNMFGSNRAAQQQIEQSAKANTERTLRGYEQAMADLARQYEQSSQGLQDRQAAATDAYRESIDTSREQQEEDLAKTIIDAWVNSNDKRGAAGNEDFIERRRPGKGKTRGGKFAMAHGFMRLRPGKALGADEAAKQQYVQDRLAQGVSYADLLNDPEFVRYIEADRNAAPLYGTWEGVYG